MILEGRSTLQHLVTRYIQNSKVICGMTGTASTRSLELLQSVRPPGQETIPTISPDVIRVDHPDFCSRLAAPRLLSSGRRRYLAKLSMPAVSAEGVWWENGERGGIELLSALQMPGCSHMKC